MNSIKINFSEIFEKKSIFEKKEFIVKIEISRFKIFSLIMIFIKL